MIKNKLFNMPGQRDIRDVFVRVMLIETFVMFVCLFFTHGKAFSWFFWWDNRDTGMDFFNSVTTLFSRDPYGTSASNYPPLASLLFWALQRFLPTEISTSFPSDKELYLLRGTNFDLRTYQQPMLLYAFFLVSFVVLFITLIESYLDDYPKARYLAIFCCLTHGVLFGIERGNIILLALLLSFAFLMGYDSHRPVIREISLLALAVAAGLKLYPALLGILLIREKKWKLALRAIIYGILAFLLPLIPFGGLRTIGEYFTCLQNFSGGHNVLGNYGLSIVSLAISFVISHLTEMNLLSLYSVVGLITKVVVATVLVLGVFSSKKRWEQCLYVVVAIVLLQPSDTYTLSFYLLPFLLLCKEAPLFSSERRMERICLLVLLSIVPLIPLSVFQQAGNLMINYDAGHSISINTILQSITTSIIVALLAQFGIGLSCIYVVWEAIKMKAGINHVKLEK